MPDGMGANFGLGIMMNARDLASGPIGMVARNFTGLINAIATGSPIVLAALVAITAAITALTLGIRGLSMAWDLAVDAGDFRRNMTAVGGIARATADEMQLLEASAIQAGIATQFSPDQAAEGLQALAAAGQNATAATETLIPVLDLAAGSLGQLGVQQAAEAVVGTLNSYRMAASEATSVTDRLLRITQLTNFQARDFEQGLSRAAATAGQYGTGLNDVLINVGLMRNANINAAVASTAFREAQTRLMTDQNAMQTVQREGITIYDEQTGRSRSALDIMMDLAESTREMSEEQRNRIAVESFGRRGMLAFNSVVNAQREVMINGNRVMLEGRDAIQYMREELENAEGTAANFRDAYLSTFPGQLDLIKGTLQTLGIVFGDVFGVIFRPLVLAVTEAINFFIRVWNEIPRSLQIAIAAIFLVLSAVMALAGGLGIVIIAVIALIMLLGELLLVALAIFAGMALAIVPVLVAFAALAGAAAFVYAAYRSNLGGLADYIDGWARRVRLLWQGLTQMFTQGFLSGEVQDELNRTENQGLMGFIGTIVDFANRAEHVWEGISKQFRKTWHELGPTFEIVVGNLQVLADTMAETFGESGIAGLLNDVPTEQADDLGTSIGQTLAGGLIIGAQFLVVFTEALILLIDTYRTLQPLGSAAVVIFEAIADAVMWVVDAIVMLMPYLQGLLPYAGVFQAIGSLGIGEAVGEAWQGHSEDVAGRRFQSAGRTEANLGYEKSAIAREEARRENQQIEAGTERPAVVQAGGEAQNANQIANAMQSASERVQRRTQRIAEISNNMNLDGERLATSVTRIQERRGVLEGQTRQQE